MLLWCFLISGMNGQEFRDGVLPVDSADLYPSRAVKNDKNPLSVPVIRKVDFSMNTGMMLITGGKNNTYTATYLAPAASFCLSPRLRIRAGALMMFSPAEGFMVSASQPETASRSFSGQMSVFAAADYLVTPRLTLSGSFYKAVWDEPFRQHTEIQALNRHYSPYRMPTQSYSLGVNYKISNGISIGAEFRFSDQYQQIPGFFPLNSGMSPGSFFW
jgi:hypothetical protein